MNAALLPQSDASQRHTALYGTPQSGWQSCMILRSRSRMLGIKGIPKYEWPFLLGHSRLYESSYCSLLGAVSLLLPLASLFGICNSRNLLVHS